jgi:hypothetical protein
MLIGAAALAVAVIPATGLASSQPGTKAKCTPATAGAAVGDSVLWMATENYGQKRALQRALGGSSAKVDTRTSRQFSEGISAMRAALGTKACAAVIALGTNGPVSPAQWREMMAVVKRVPRVVVVNTYTRDHLTRNDGQKQFWMQPLNSQIAGLRSNKNVRVVDWHRAASRKSSLLEPDGVHPNVSGSKEYVNLIVAALNQP